MSLLKFFEKCSQSAASTSTKNAPEKVASEMIVTAARGSDEPLVQTEQKLKPDEVLCVDCNHAYPKGECHAVGRAKKIFKCNKCNSLNQRVASMMKGTYAAQAWQCLSKEEKQAFRDKSQELKDAALKEGLTASLKHTITTRVTEFGGKQGDYLTLSVYETKGYSRQACGNLKKNALCRYDPIIGEDTYALLVFQVEDRTEQLTETEVLWRTCPPAESAADEQDEGSKPAKIQKVTPTSTKDNKNVNNSQSSKDDTSASQDSTDSEAADKNVNKKRRIPKKAKADVAKAKKAAKKAAKKERKLAKKTQVAKKVLAALAAPLKTLRTGLNERLTKVTTDKVPLYVRTDAVTSLEKLEQHDSM